MRLNFTNKNKLKSMDGSFKNLYNQVKKIEL
jgi:hypothetical protein